ncbi:MAG TPA: PKD domain-containing protein [Gemmatimonadales bacterium]|nr:PKD domain-containing protein [Gemmatimonadales bacterium]
MAPSHIALLASVQGPDAEPNNTCFTAQNFATLELPFTLNGSLDGSPLPGGGDVDFVRFTGTPGTTLRVDLEGQSTGQGTLSDPFLGWFDSGCNLLAINDDNGSTLNSRLLVTIPSDGVFILAVTRCCDFSFDQGGAGTYQLNIQELLPPSNDDFLNATSIGALPFGDPVDLSAATIQDGEPTPSCGVPFGPVSRTAWYTFTSPEPRSVFASNSAPFATVVGVYTGSSLDALTEVSCRTGSVAFNAEAGTTYHIVVGGLFDQGGLLEFRLGDTPAPVAAFGFNPFDPSVFDVVQFFDLSFDSAGQAIQSQQWLFGDGAIGTGCCPTHHYAADGDYTVQLTITTFDGRTASTSQPMNVRTHDVAITRLTAPTAASTGQARAIVVGVKNKRYPETVEVLLFKSVPGGFESVGSVTKSVPLSVGNSITSFDFSYTFTPADASIGKVTFKAFAIVIGGRDALQADNEAIAPPTRVSAGPSLRGAIAFHSIRDGDFDIYAMNPDGSGVMNLTNSTDQEIDEIWSPDGSQVAFAKCAGACDVFFTEIFVINANGTGLTQLTHGGGFLGAWSPDRKQIVFVRDGVGILIMNADGTGVTPTNQNGRPTAWSPNGKQILFQSDRDGDNDFYVMNVDGSGVIQITNDPASDEGDFAAWSPDGRRIVFSSTRDGGDLDIFTMNPDGSGVTQITRNDLIEDDDPVWSPDGSHIAFHSTRAGTEEIFVMNADGSDPIQLTFNSRSAVPAWRAKSLP